MNNKQKSTYSLLVSSEEKNRSVLEVALYAVFTLSAVVSIWQFALQPVTIPADETRPSTEIVSAAVQNDRA